MKKLIFSLLSLGFFTIGSQAQTKTVETAKISAPSVQCNMCKNRIEQYLKRIDGVTFVNVVPKKKEINVKYLTDRTNIEMIKASIANAGYDVAKTPAGDQPSEIEIAANPDSYKALPKCCKKPEDGGGMPKQ